MGLFLLVSCIVVAIDVICATSNRDSRKWGSLNFFIFFLKSCIMCVKTRNCIVYTKTRNSLKPTPDPSLKGKIPPPSLWRAKHASSICCSCHISCQLSHETVCSHQDVEVRITFHRGVLRYTRRCSTVRSYPQQTATVCRGRNALCSVPGSAGVKPCAV